MKTLYLMRHGKSSWDDADLADHDRPLAPRGIKAATAVGLHLARHHVHPGLALCSTALRAADTLDLVLAELKTRPTVEREHGLYLCGERVLLERIRDVPDSAGELLLVAHNPDLHNLSLRLCAEDHGDLYKALHLKFPTGACAVFTFDTDRWADIGPAQGRLVDFIRPRKLS